MRVPRGNVEIGKMGGAEQAPPFGSTLSQQPQRTHQKIPNDTTFSRLLGEKDPKTIRKYIWPYIASLAELEIFSWADCFC